MSRAAITVLVFSIHLLILGPTLIVAPNAFLAVFHIAETSEVWIRVVGMLALILGFYYFTAARHELVPLRRATVLGRFAALALFVAVVLLGLAPPVLVLFGLVDGAAAVWTAMALRAPQLMCKPRHREAAGSCW